MESRFGWTAMHWVDEPKLGGRQDCKLKNEKCKLQI
jgi:hypothetical protein